MSNKVYNINDYRRGPGGDTVENIRIEDPLDFLDATEKEAYIRERHREENERLKQVEEEEKKASEAVRALPDEERARIKRDTDDPMRGERVKHAEQPRRRRMDYGEEEYEEEEEDDDGSSGILIASGVLAVLIIAVVLFIFWIRFMMPKPAEPEAEERAIQQAVQQEEKQEREDAADEAAPEEEWDEYDLLLPDGYVRTGDVVIVTADRGLNLRSAPDSASNDNIVIKVARDTKLTRIAENPVQGWSAVILEGLDEMLFCSSAYLKTE